MNKSIAIMAVLGATQAIKITKVGDPVTATDATPVLDSSTEGIADARSFLNIGVRFVHPNGPVSTGTVPISETATEGITDARHSFVQFGDEPNMRNANKRSMMQKWMGTKSKTDPISPEGMDDWVYEYSKDNTNSQTQWHDLKHKPSEYNSVQTGW